MQSTSRLYTTLSLLALLFTIFESSAQKRLLVKLDTSWNDPNPYLQEYTAKTFKSSFVAEKLIDPKQVDVDLLSAAIFFEVNNWRVKKRKGVYIENSKLDGIAYKYLHHYKRYRFRKSIDNYLKLKKTLNKTPRYLNLDFKHMEGHVILPYIMDYKKGSFYYNEELGVSRYNLYLGKYDRRDSLFVPEPIEQLTYEQFAKNVLSSLLKGKSATFLRSKAYELMAIRATLPKKRKDKKYIPKVKIIYLIGAYQNKYIKEMEK